MHKVEHEHGKEVESEHAELGEHILDDGVSWSMLDTVQVVHTCIGTRNLSPKMYSTALLIVTLHLKSKIAFRTFSIDQ